MKNRCKDNRAGAGRIVLIVGSLVFAVWFLLSFITGILPNHGNITGTIVFLVLACYGIFLPQINSFLKRLWKTTAGKVLEILVGLILAVILSLAALTYGCMLHAAGRPPAQNSAVIVLGCKVNGYRPSLTLYNRLNAALQYMEKNPEAVCVVSGGQGAGEITTEGSVMYQWLLDQGIAKERLFAENASSDTQENLLFSKSILQKQGLDGKKVTLVTSDFHACRALYYAKKEGIDADCLSAPTPWWLYPTYVVREMYGILESWFLK